MNPATPSPISHAAAFTNEAQRAAVANHELGASFDFRVLGHILADDKEVHAKIANESADIVGDMAAILADGVVTRDEMPKLAAIQRHAATIGELARV
jgi:hypothetical protein